MNSVSGTKLLVKLSFSSDGSLELGCSLQSYVQSGWQGDEGRADWWEEEKEDKMSRYRQTGHSQRKLLVISYMLTRE